MAIELAPNRTMRRVKPRRSEPIGQMIFDLGSDIGLQNAVVTAGVEEGNERAVCATGLKLEVDPR